MSSTLARAARNMTSSDGYTYFEHPDWTGTTRVRTDQQNRSGCVPERYHSSRRDQQGAATLHETQQGTVTPVLLYAGNVAGSMTSLPFGDGTSLTINNANADAETAHYAMQDKDFYGTSDSGTNHALFRQYMDTVGSWMSPDPYLGSYDASNPQSMNRYSYVQNNPLSYVDPDGTTGCQDGDPTCDPDCEVAECSVAYPNGPSDSGGPPAQDTAYLDASGNVWTLEGYDSNNGDGIFLVLPGGVGNVYDEPGLWPGQGLIFQFFLPSFAPSYGQVAPQMGGGGGSGSAGSGGRAAGLTWGQKNQSCLNQINNTPDGWFYNHFSYASPLLGPDAGWGAFSKEVASDGAQEGAKSFFRAAARNWAGTGLGSMGGGVSAAWELADSLVFFPVNAAATAGQLTVHAGCAISAAF